MHASAEWSEVSGNPRAEDVEGVARAEIEAQGEDEEGRTARAKAMPYVPSDKERREHNATHYLFQSWCEHCVAGRAIAGPHLHGGEKGNSGGRGGSF